MNSLRIGLPQPFSEPALATIVPQKSHSSKGFSLTPAGTIRNQACLLLRLQNRGKFDPAGTSA